ncbi:hypothetical protein A9Q86_00820 [Flavobacteriales bacterium 33_180_T64]|nr:hypothetical protein A9Q86_00820 [Flavobacteriales bacterium 33_180_T64]
MRIVDIPQKFNEDAYYKVMDKQVEVLSKVKGVKSIYQIGGLSTPGISDIDLVVVFEDDFTYDLNPRSNNSDIGNYLFTHGLYGASETHFKSCLKFTFFHNFRLLYGQDIDLKNHTKGSDQSLLKEQIALEFLFKMYVNLVVQKAYKTIKLRSLFLHIKALPYDFEFLNIHPEGLIELVDQGIYLRNNWLEGKVSKKDIKEWFNQFFKAYELFLVSLFNDYSIYAPALNFKIAPNIEINNANTLDFSKKGFVIPDAFNVLDKKYFKVLNRLNDFRVDVPLKVDAPNIIDAYFKYADQVGDYNRKHLPYFMTLTSSLKVYK